MKRLIGVVLCICLITSAVAIIGWLPKWNLYSVQTPSMGAAVPKGSLVIVKKGNNVFGPGVVASYRHPLNKSMVVTHRITGYDAASQTYTFKGDANQSPDVPVPKANLIGNVVRVIPHIGQMITILKTPLGLLFAVYLPAGLIIVYEVSRVVAYRKNYRLHV